MRRKAVWDWLLRPLLLIALSVPLLGIGGLEAVFAPKKEPWQRWQAHDPASRTKIEHDDWENLLQRYVKTDRQGVNRVDYAALNKTGRDDLEAYIAYLAAQPVSNLTRDEQLAYWINLYTLRRRVPVSESARLVDYRCPIPTRSAIRVRAA